jgi:hypothetical protein
LYTDYGEVLVSFDSRILEWYPSVVILLPGSELFEYLLSELTHQLEAVTEEGVMRVAGSFTGNVSEVWTEDLAISDALVATYATDSERRLTLDSPVPNREDAEKVIHRWLSESSKNP